MRSRTRWLWPCAAASALCVGLVLVRFAYVGGGRFRFSGLLLNLLLAAIPLALVLVLRGPARHRGKLVRLATFAVWLLFFPNAFYLTTDLIHAPKFGTDGVFVWYDLLTTAGFAFAGACLGGFSLRLLHTAVDRSHGRVAGWAFAVAALALGSFGVFLGRFLRFNSWDVAFRPLELLAGVAGLAEPGRGRTTLVFCLTFFVISLSAYGFVFAATRMVDPGRPGGAGGGTKAGVS